MTHSPSIRERGQAAMGKRLRLIWAGLVDLWCDWTHGGGHIERDPLGRVNWQCNKCGRWADLVPAGVPAVPVHAECGQRHPVGTACPAGQKGPEHG